MTKIKILLSVVLLATVNSFCSADTAGDLARENAELKQRVETLENEMAALKAIVMQQVKEREAAEDEPNTAAAAKLNDADMKKIAEMIQRDTSQKKPILSSLDMEVYGFLKFDAAYDSSRIDNGNYAKCVESEETNKGDSGVVEKVPFFSFL